MRMSEEHDESIQLEQVTEVTPKPKRVYKKKSVLSPELAPPSISPSIPTEQKVAPLAPPSIPPSIPTEQKVDSLAPPSIPTENVIVPVVKETKARTQKQIDAFNKMREAYLNKRKTPVIEPVKEPEHVKEPEQIKEEPYELGNKKVQKLRAKKIKVVNPDESPHDSPVQPVPQPPALVRQVSTAPRFVFV